MGLSNALFTGLSGLNVSQAKLNVVGNNIANVNTVAFKSSRVLFKPQFYVTDANGTQPSDQSGGTNPSQRGLGAVVAAIDRNLNTGSIETTGRDTDMAIDGEGYFIVKSDGVKYTRDGSFHLNEQNQLVTSSGDLVQGYGIDKDFNITFGQLSNINIPLKSLTTAKATTQVSLKGNLNAKAAPATVPSILTTGAMTIAAAAGGGAPDATTLLVDLAYPADPADPSSLEKPVFELDASGTAALTLKGTKGDTPVKESTFTITATTTVSDLMTFFQDNLGINTMVPDDGNPLTPMPGLSLQDPDPLGSSNRLLNIIGNLGLDNKLQIEFNSSTGVNNRLTFNDNNAAFSGVSVQDSVKKSAIIYDSLGAPVTVNVTTVLESKATNSTVWRFYVESPDSTSSNPAVGTGTLTFDGNGRLVDYTGTRISIPRDGTGAVTPLTFDLDVSQLNCFNDDGTVSGLNLAQLDGSSFGTLQSFSVGEDGIITGNFDNGTTRTLGQLAVALFSNPQALIDRGGNMFSEGPGSGAPIITTPTSLGAGKVQPRSLEMSNVDLSEEFVNLIIASTGFAASSRVISTSDQLIQELLNTSR